MRRPDPVRASPVTGAASATLDIPRGLLLIAGLAYLAFVIYGSLVPLDFVAIDLDQAVVRFRAIPFLDLGIGSRADWVANILLFIPLAFLWTGLLAAGRGWLTGSLVSLLVLAACVGLSLGIEFTQLFFPQRTVSQNDIYAECLGAMLGVLAWWGAGDKLLGWYVSWRGARSPADLAEQLAWVYLAGLFAYNLLPLDLTISGVELFHKWREGKLYLIPFANLPADPALAVYGLAADVSLWLVMALLWGLKRRAGALSPWLMVLLCAALLEFLQLFVYSRVSDTTDLFTGAAGGLLGGWVASRFADSGKRSRGPVWSTAMPAFLLPLSMALLWMAVLLAVFWYPFDFEISRGAWGERMRFFDRVPFEAYYFGTEFRAITEVLHKTLFFAPLGAALAWTVAALPWTWRAPMALLALVCIPLLAFAVELGQVFLPDKIVDSTDWFLASLGGYAGYALYRAIRVRLRSATVTRASPHPSNPPRRHRRRHA